MKWSWLWFFFVKSSFWESIFRIKAKFIVTNTVLEHQPVPQLRSFILIHVWCSTLLVRWKQKCLLTTAKELYLLLEFRKIHFILLNFFLLLLLGLLGCLDFKISVLGSFPFSSMPILLFLELGDIWDFKLWGLLCGRRDGSGVFFLDRGFWRVRSDPKLVLQLVLVNGRALDSVHDEALG